jgi:DNA-binding transcriptional LysR family regulator
MELEQLRQLDVIERDGTISAAAEELHITQPSLSRSVRRLEADLGQELFDRTRNHVMLNDIGYIALDHARAILAEEKKMRDVFDELSRRQRTLRIATVAPAPSWHLTSLVVNRFPGTILVPEIMDEDHVRSSLISRTADLGITLCPLQLPEVDSIPIMTEDLFLSAPVGNRLAKRDTVTFSDMDGEPFLVLDQIGFWMDVCRRRLPTSQIIVQKDQTVFAQIVASTSLCCFTTDAVDRASNDANRIRVPIADADAHATFFVNAQRDATERVRQIIALLGKK